MKSLSILFTALLGLIPLLHAAQKPNLSVSDSLQQTNTPDKVRYVPVPLKAADESGILIADVSLDGQQGRFLIDSGAGYGMLVGSHFATRLGKETQQSGEVHGVGGAHTMLRADFHDIKVGGIIRMEGQKLGVIEMSDKVDLKVGGVKIRADGLIGSKFFKSSRAVVDFRNLRLLAPAGDAPVGAFAGSRKQAGDYVLRLSEGKSAYPFATVRIRDHDYTFLIDTGAAINSIEPALVKELGLKTESTGVGVTGGGGSRNNLDRVVLSDSIVAGARIRRLECYVMEEKVAAAAPPGTRFGGTLGAGFLRDHYAMLDFDAYALILTSGQERKP